ncbi:MAG: hypothetical protein ACFCU6_04230 [Balneolaceae bacterium]
MKISFPKNTKNFPVNIIVFLLLILFISGCGNSDDQRKFEQQAFQQPSGITETDNQGNIISNDPDDWRIAPIFQGLVEVSPAFPNPVSINGQLRIELDIKFLDSVNGIEVAVLFQDRSVGTLFDDPSIQIPPGLQVIDINPLELGRFESEVIGLHRILILDIRRNIISYGDVRVVQ